MAPTAPVPAWYEAEAGVRLYPADAYQRAFNAIPVTRIAALVALFYVPETYYRQKTG